MARIQTISERGLNLIAQFEGLKLKAYLDTGGVWTLGIGTTRYPNGLRVKAGDTCTQEQALMWLKLDTGSAAKAVDDLTRDDITQSNFDALTSFVYNVGQNAYRNSTLRKVVNANPQDPRIRTEFAKWVYDNGKKIQGLLNRRVAEASLYFS